MRMAAVPVIHFVIVIWGFVEIILFAGVIFGWHSMVYIYKDEGYFTEGCHTGNTSSTHTDNSTTMSNTLWAASAWSNATTLSTPSYLSNVTDVFSTTPASELSCEKLQQMSGGKSSQSCVTQDKEFSFIFTLATVITGILCILNGYLYDHLGTRFCRCLSIVCFITALACLIAASPDNVTLLYPGFILQVYAGYALMVTNMQLAGLVPRFRATLISMCSGAYDSSAAMFLLMKIAHEYGIKVNYCFAFQLCLFTMVIISTIFIHRKSRIPWPLPPNFKFRFTLCEYLDKKKNKMPQDEDAEFKWTLNENGSVVKLNLTENDSHFTKDCVISEKDISDVLTMDKLNDTETSHGSNGHGDTNYQPPKVPSILEIVKTPLFMWNLEWMCFMRLRSWFFVSSFNPWITRLACGDKDKVSHYTSFFAMVQFIGVFSSPLSGRLMDRQIPATKIYNNHKYERLHASIASLVLCSLMTLVFSILVAIPVIEIQYISCILHSLCRSFIYGPNFAFAANAYPIEHFGKVTGLILTISAVFGMLQHPLFLLIQGPLDNNPLVVDILLIVMVLLSFGHPLYIWNFLRKERQKIEQGKK